MYHICSNDIYHICLSVANPTTVMNKLKMNQLQLHKPHLLYIDTYRSALECLLTFIFVYLTYVCVLFMIYKLLHFCICLFT